MAEITACKNTESLTKYTKIRERLQNLLEHGEKITPKQWKAKIESLQTEYGSIGKEKLKTIIELAYAEVTGCDYMKQIKIPPHVTVSALVSDNEEALLLEMESIAELMNKDFIWFANIGVFNPLVIYLGPVMNEFLQNTCRTVNERLLKYGDVGNRGQYLPNQWVPHAAIAVKLTSNALKEAFAIVQEKFSAFGATAEKIILARTEPYKELCSWKLKE